MLFSTWADASLAAVIGLIIGSFLNVVILRTPRMMYRDWLRESLDSLRAAPSESGNSESDGADIWPAVFGQGHATPADLATASQKAFEQVQTLPPLTLSRPRSTCRECGHAIRWYENIPVISFIFLRGRCSGCGQPYGWRYPLIELLTAALFGFCGWRWGISATGALWATFSALLIALTFIDWDTTLLPDHLVLPLLWLGLAASATHLTDVRLADAVWGAMAGYLSLWSVCGLFKLITGKQGMGNGDFKLLAALCAWMGWQALIPIVLMSSIIGVIAGVALKLSRQLRAGGYFPFGPFLAGAGLVAMMLGPQTLARAILP